MGLSKLKSRIYTLFTTPLVLRFRLRTVFLLMSAASIWLAWQALNARQQREAIAAIGRYGGSVFYDFNDRNRVARPAPWKAYLAHLIGDEYVFSVIGVGLNGRAVNDQAMAEIVPHLANLNDLRWLDIDNVQVTDAGIAHLSQLGELRTLLLRSQGYNAPRLCITDEGLKFVANLTRLESLIINDAPITGRGLTDLAKLTQLVSLNLDSTDVDDDGLRFVGQVRNLKRLRLRDTKISGDGLVYLKRLERLEELDLLGAPLGGNTAGLALLRNLRTLDLSGSQITDRSLDHLSQLRELRVLRLYRTNLTDCSILALKSLVNLKELKLQGSRVSVEAGRELAQLIPACSIDGTSGSVTHPWSVPASRY